MESAHKECGQLFWKMADEFSQGDTACAPKRLRWGQRGRDGNGARPQAKTIFYNLSVAIYKYNIPFPIPPGNLPVPPGQHHVLVETYNLCHIYQKIRCALTLPVLHLKYTI